VALPADIAKRLSVPVIAAPMTGVSGLDLVIAACRNGVIGSFPTHNATSIETLDRWLGAMNDELGPSAAPVAPNLVVHPTNTRLAADLDRLVAHGTEIVITSVGSPKPVVGPLHDAGCLVYADVATLKQAQKAIALGVDGLVLLSAGAGGQTGQANPFAFVRAVRGIFEGTIVLAGGISDGVSLFASEVLGADLGYMGTRFIATEESLASADYQQAVVSSTMDDVRLSDEVGGLPASLLGDWLDGRGSGPVATGDFQQDRLVADPSVWSAGHSVSGVRGITSVGTLVEQVRSEYVAARSGLRSALDKAS